MIEFFLKSYENTPLTNLILEFIVFVLGIVSVLFARKENILVYPTGLVATILSTYLLYLAGYLGDMLINAYYSMMSIYGWYNWSRKDTNNIMLPISRTNWKEKWLGITLFLFTMVLVYYIYLLLDYEIKTVNYIDILATGIFFTGMWYMAKKKIENWILWIIGNIIVIPLFAYRGLGMLTLQYIIFTILAIIAYLEWKKILQKQKA